MFMIIMQHILIVLELNIFQKKLEKSSKIKTSWQIFIKKQAYDAIMRKKVFIGVIDFMLKVKNLSKYKIYFLLMIMEYKIILRYFQ